MARFAAGSSKGRGVVENLSPTGLCLTCKRVFAPGTVLEIEVLIDRMSCPLVGVVRWARQYPETMAHVIPSGMGIQIRSVSKAYLELLQRLEGKSAQPGKSPG